MKNNYHIVNGTCLLYDDGKFTIGQKDLFIEGDRIIALGTAGEMRPGKWEKIDAAGKLVMPGLINLHTHAYMTLMRGYADDVDFGEWLFKRVMPVEDHLPPECAYWTSLLGYMEMIRTGTTCFMDMHMYPGQPPKAAQEAGIRAYFGRGLVGERLDITSDRRFLEAIGEMEQWESERIRFTLAPHAIYSCSPAFYAETAVQARERGLLLQTHLSESETEVRDCREKYGMSPVELLWKAGFLGSDTIAAHCVKVDERDIGILAESKTNVVSNPASNAKLGNGFAPLCKMADAGINICLGTDGAASNNTLNLFREMGLAALIHKGLEKSSVAAPAQTVLAFATVHPARALGREKELGVLAPGAKADLIFLNLNEPSLFPPNNIVSSLCYSANGSEVESVMIDGSFVMKNREFLTIDQEKVYHEIRRAADRFL